MGFVFIISTARRDRHGTTLNINGWDLENYRANPIVLYGDQGSFTLPDPDQAIGTSKVWIENEKLYADWTPDPSSETAAKIVKKLCAGTSLGASVLFLPKAKDQQELIGWKIVAVASNPDCVYQPLYNSISGKRKRLYDLKLKHNL